MLYTLVTLVAFILILGLLVIVHELGHFLTARLFGVRVEEFGIGFPPRLYPSALQNEQRRRAGKTVYSLNLLPLGGFVRLAGENGGRAEERDEAQREDLSPIGLSGRPAEPGDTGSFSTKPAWQRAIILIAGTVNNMLLAMLLLFILLVTAGVPQSRGVRVVAVEQGSPAQRAGLRPGDLLRALNSHPLRGAAALVDGIDAHRGRVVRLRYTRGGAAYTALVRPRAGHLPCDAGPLGLMPFPVSEQLVPLAPGEAAAHAFSLPLDVIRSITSALGAVKARAATGAAADAACRFVTPYRTVSGRITDAGQVRADEDAQLSRMQGSDLCAPASGVGITGPVGIIRQIGCEANGIGRQGWSPLLALVIDLSATLAVINLLPIPALDGGRLLFVLIGAVTRRRISPVAEARAHAVGMIALLTLMMLVSVNDVANWIHQKPVF